MHCTIMMQWYKKLTSNKKCLLLLGVFDAFVFVCLIPFAFFSMDNGYWLGTLMLGWLLGSIAQLIAYVTIVFTSKMLTTPNGTSATGTLMGAGGFFIRYFLYAAVLALSAICTFKSEWLLGFDKFNVFTCGAALVVLSFFVMIFKVIEMRGEADPVKKQEESN